MSNTSLGKVRFVAFIALSFSALIANAQLQVNESVAKDSLAKLITGNGVTISNVDVKCTTTSSGRGYGSYTAGTNSMGLTQGLLLTTGRAQNAIGPNNTASKTSQGNLNLASNDTYKKLLENYSGGKRVNEYCLFSFDIIPQGDTIKFDYVFASEEYNEYVNSDFNDVFGFFISGPGITGEANASGRMNIAKVPGTSTSVSINNVNNGYKAAGQTPTGPCNNCAYYEHNTGSYTQYDGYTKNLVAYSKVIPCSTYKLELIIADCGDKQYDSGVFIEKIRSNTATVTATTVAGIPDAIEGCNAGIFTFTRPAGSSTAAPLTVNYWLSGSAQNGVDYNQIGSTNPIAYRTMVIPAGQNSADLVITPIADGIPEPTEEIKLSLFNYTCPAGSGDFITIPIRDSIYTSISPKNPVVCEGTPITMNSTNGVNYVWSSNSSTNSSAIYTLNSTQTISVTAKVGLCEETKSTTVTVNPLPLVRSFDTPVEPCLGALAELKLKNSENGISYQLVKTPGNTPVGTSVLGDGSDKTFITTNISAPTSFMLNAVNQATGCYRNDIAAVTVTPPSKPMTPANNNDSRTCLVGGNDWIVFTAPGTSRAIASINPRNQFLGWVTVQEFINGNTQNVQACGTDPINQPQFTTAAFGRNWVVTPEYQPSSNVDVRLYFDNADLLATQAAANANANPEDDILNISSIGLTKYSGPNEDNNFANNCYTGGVTTLHSQTNNGNVSSVYTGFTNSGRFVTFEVPSFSELWLHGFSQENPSPLPVVLKEFSANCVEDGVELVWATTSEVNNNYFSVQYSANGIEWSEIAQVAGMGNSNQLVQYTYKDKSRRNGIGYYRISQFDYNGANETFPMTSSNCSFGEEVKMGIYPNPSNGEFFVQVYSDKAIENASVVVFDMTGKVVYNKEFKSEGGSVEVGIRLEHLAKGAFIVRLNGVGLESISPVKVIIQ